MCVAIILLYFFVCKIWWFKAHTPSWYTETNTFFFVKIKTFYEIDTPKISVVQFHVKEGVIENQILSTFGITNSQADSKFIHAKSKENNNTRTYIFFKRRSKKNSLKSYINSIAVTLSTLYLTFFLLFFFFFFTFTWNDENHFWETPCFVSLWNCFSFSDYLFTFLCTKSSLNTDCMILKRVY